MDEESRWKITDIEVPFKCVVLWWLKQAPLVIVLSLVVALANYAVLTQFMRYQVEKTIKQITTEVEKMFKGETTAGATGGAGNLDYWQHK